MLWLTCASASMRRCRQRACRYFVRALRFAVPQWRADLRERLAACQRSGSRTRASMGWTGIGRPGKKIARREPEDKVRLLAPFDPIVRDRDRFELLWGWPVPLRSLHAAAQTQARLLRSAAALARSGDRLGQPLSEKRRAQLIVRLRGSHAHRKIPPSRANSKQSWPTCVPSSASSLERQSGAAKILFAICAAPPTSAPL